MQMVTKDLDVDYTDVFSILEPCADNIPTLGGNRNHYLHRHGNTFAGNTGKALYFGLFLPNVCDAKRSSKKG